MREDGEDSTLFLAFELLHALERETGALQKAIERELLLDDSNKKTETSRGSLNLRNRSFYRDLEWRMARGQLNSTKTTRTLFLIIREVNLFRVMVQNFLGSVTHDQPLTLDKRPVKLIPIIEEVVDLFEFSATDKGVELRTHLAGDPTVIVDRELIHRVLVNLIDNAIKYSYSSAEYASQRYISIESRRHSKDGDWLLSVASYGVGIDEAEISSGFIFKYGARGAFASERNRVGTGIGLAEAKRIVEAHQGKINVESHKLAGGETFLTTVKVVIPS